MPPRRSRGKSSVEDDNNSPIGIVTARVWPSNNINNDNNNNNNNNNLSINGQHHPRMGHTSYIHPKSGLLYLVGGCDLTGLPQVLKSQKNNKEKKEKENKCEPMPFAEWWNPETQMWGVTHGTPLVSLTQDVNNNNNNNNNTEKKEEEKTIPAEAVKVVKITGEKTDYNVNANLTNDNNNKNNNNTNMNAKLNSTTITEKCIIGHRPVQIPNDFVWPTLAAAVVHWGPLRTRKRPPTQSQQQEQEQQQQEKSQLQSTETVNNNNNSNNNNENNNNNSNNTNAVPQVEVEHIENDKNNKDTHDMTLNTTTNTSNTNSTSINSTSTESVIREHPVILFIGGWQGNSRVSHALAIDMDKGIVFEIRGGNSSSSSPPLLTCNTCNIARNDRVYVFGGNTLNGSSYTMNVLDITSFKWGEGQLRETHNNNSNNTHHPIPRSSHVAGLLLNRYIIIYGGRRLAPTQAVTPAKGKKVDPKAIQPITKLNLDFCNDVAIYNVDSEKWTAISLTVGSQGPPPRYGHAACVLSSTELFIHGGIGSNGEILSDAWILRVQEKTESSVSISWIKVLPLRENETEDSQLKLPARCYHSMASSERRVYLTGGISNSDIVKDVCIMDVEPILNMIAITPVEGRRRTLSRKESKRLVS